jgi:phage replication-related protein YjqB (UPF0714/DUF867 family)
MAELGRRTVLGAAAALAAGAAVLAEGGVRRAHAADDLYPSNSALYADPAVTEGVDYGLRFRRHAVAGDSVAGAYAFPATCVLAPHGGGIEPGTSELCLAVAGYHPNDFSVSGPVYDYWMFEGLRSSGNGELHVTSTHCDDPVARSLAGGSRNALTLHGCTASQAGAPAGSPEAVVVGGRNQTFKGHLTDRLGAAGFRTIDGDDVPALAGVHPDNIANRTLLGAGAQLELTTELRKSMFGVNTRAERRRTLLDPFWGFVGAVRESIVLLEQGR